MNAGGDLDVSTGDLRLVTGADAVEQHLKIRLRFFLGEWKLNPLEGIPYYDKVLVKNPDVGVIEVLFRRVILTTPGVVSLDDLELTLSAERVLSVDFTATLDTGEAVVVEDFVLD